MSTATDALAPLEIVDFETFYHALYQYRPFQWQQRMAAQVCAGDWPDYIKLPTSSGKTAVIDIAVFALAYQAARENCLPEERSAPRRIFFVVDRRIIVNEAYRRAKAMAVALRDVLDPHTVTNYSDEDRRVLVRVGRWLQRLSGSRSAPPLDCFELRGGIYRDDAWIRSPLQPTVLTSTVDQVGSRLLFRGYGSSNRNLPIHAALTANDSLIVLDEAHCSAPFSETMNAIRQYRGKTWSQIAVATPFRFVQMTATPPPNVAAEQVFELLETDYHNDPPLQQRHRCAKPVALVQASGAKGKKLPAVLARKLVEQAEELAGGGVCHKIAIVVNRVAIAREAFSLLEKKYPGHVSLMIGRMRPWDRDRLTDTLQRQFGSKQTGSQEQPASCEETQPQFLVATQCIEVGADLDFDAMVSQCASLDALRQRFGRLNRLGRSPHARGAIVAAEEDVISPEKIEDAKPRDPIYGNSLVRTWHWLNQHAAPEDELNGADATRVLDFGVQPFEELCKSVASGGCLDSLTAPAPHAPVLMPAHVDMLCQTSPRPTPEPDVSAYLHGVGRETSEIQVCWRADLDLCNLSGDQLQQLWIAAVDSCPPSSAECLTISLYDFRRWLRGESVIDDSGDVLGEQVPQEETNPLAARRDRTVLVWRGRRNDVGESEASFLANSSNDRRLRRGDTIVIPAEFGGWKTLGHVPDAPPDPSEPSDEALFSTTDPSELHRILMSRDSAFADASEATAIAADEGNGECEPRVRELTRIDIADSAFLQSRARTIWRIHAKLQPEPELQTLWRDLLQAATDDDADLAWLPWRTRVEGKRDSAMASRSPGDLFTATRLERLADWSGSLADGKILRYPNGLVWITRRHPSLAPGMLPLPSFGDDDDSLSLTARVPLTQHLSDVVAEMQNLCELLDIPTPLAGALIAAARVHDLGKADPRFQAMLSGKPLHIAYMQPRLWAKSDGSGISRTAELPGAFRHEMVSLSLVDYFELSEANVDEALLKHIVAAHHGYARPFAPVCIDESPPGLNLQELGGGTLSEMDRSAWIPAHRLDSGVAERFWMLNRRYGSWGLAYLESLLRLADWQASAQSGHGKEAVSFTAKPRIEKVRGAAESPKPLVLAGIDGSNPLGFLAALGAFRVLSALMPECELRLKWTPVDGAWRPVFWSPNDILDEEDVVAQLDQVLRIAPDEHPVIRMANAVDSVGSRNAFLTAATSANLTEHVDAEWLSCNGSDVVSSDAISQLQTTRRDYHTINIRGLLKETTIEHLQRTLFRPWDYADAVAGVSLHLEPREDRRHAYQWHMPSGDPTRNSSGGMIGANRLALEAWPFFQSLPSGDRLTTTGFRGTRVRNTLFAWPIWSLPIDVEVLRTVLAWGYVHGDETDRRMLAACGVTVIYRCRRILVGKTPNLTSAVAVLS